MTNTKTYFEVLKWASSFLENNHQEAYIAEYLLLEKNRWTKTDLLMNFKKQMPLAEYNAYKADLEKVTLHIPVQYLIGSTEFYGRRFKVNEHTLIPRPETEELVELILKDNYQENLEVVDIGTGTGIIALSLSLENPTWKVTGLDISKEALKIATKNNQALEGQVHFLESDVLSKFPKNKKIDILVSNPPYISYDEWEEMDESVREYEPKQALFAENNGLAIYEKIAKESTTVLSETGRIYLEIGYLQGESVSQIFKEAYPTKSVRVIKDLNGQDRIIEVK
ncbi:peptide chain release factor N(5)-glutamine methyltransferase [Vagococcus fluvialis]|uniref:peptide chain release factor N(5)-glutamine methyltransferase n=1 Tax=Vagococcus fluvialis TaxID=2738 RepID=UPI001432E5E6|nr:peptide chain release factor N(5)-glutamine methyltransferase [Vagococcus fluvialis]MDT2747258.1 peptide chain release factor N(5)-glutamine methyltransferase [Vagococcus fluvialis]NKC60241.1 peptide chain release factor N(5)-glutamine methyltransferase [Vagococcus fluvialis]NKD50981.1 peptide chain release factor N(5)-glutamine methyltransferase [Vagococcus fluvialis]UDM72063.1 peptide chain release factor N(5)-glutamine methyltransferase [Vagococcus fluvialis]UDM76927.1 peptide chain rele